MGLFLSGEVLNESGLSFGAARIFLDARRRRGLDIRRRRVPFGPLRRRYALGLGMLRRDPRIACRIMTMARPNPCDCEGEHESADPCFREFEETREELAREHKDEFDRHGLASDFGSLRKAEFDASDFA
ncbi:MAG: hypothetical protein ACR65Z_15620 [Methylocystis sp.]